MQSCSNNTRQKCTSRTTGIVRLIEYPYLIRRRNRSSNDRIGIISFCRELPYASLKLILMLPAIEDVHMFLCFFLAGIGYL